MKTHVLELGEAVDEAVDSLSGILQAKKLANLRRLLPDKSVACHILYRNIAHTRSK